MILIELERDIEVGFQGIHVPKANFCIGFDCRLAFWGLGADRQVSGSLAGKLTAKRNSLMRRSRNFGQRLRFAGSLVRTFTASQSTACASDTSVASRWN